MALAFSRAWSTACINMEFPLKSAMVSMVHPDFSEDHWAASGSRVVLGTPVRGSAWHFKAKRQVKYFLLSPITTTVDKSLGNSAKMLFSIGTGAIFSPPEVIKSS